MRCYICDKILLPREIVVDADMGGIHYKPCPACLVKIREEQSEVEVEEEQDTRSLEEWLKDMDRVMVRKYV